jgi:hypothetical protein
MTPDEPKVKRWVSDRDGNMEWDGRDMRLREVREDSYVLATDYAALKLDYDALRSRLEAVQRVADAMAAAIENANRGSTHWEGCAGTHWQCAALDAYRAATSAEKEQP